LLVTSVGVIFNQWGLNSPQPPPPDKSNVVWQRSQVWEETGEYCQSYILKHGVKRCWTLSDEMNWCLRHDACALLYNGVLAGAPKYVTDKLQRVLNAEAWLISGIRKYDRGLSSPLHDALHWLDVPERIQFKLHGRHSASLHREVKDPVYLLL